MKRLIFDYFRRRAWIFALAGIVQVALGWGHAGYAGEAKNPLASLQFAIGMFTGAFLLLLDLRRGFARVISTLPLTAREIGRAWWWATVGIPAVGFTTLLLVGVAARCCFDPSLTVVWPGIFLIVVTLPLWLGASFAVIMYMPRATSGMGKNRALPQVAGILLGLMPGGGFLFFKDFADSPVKFGLFVILCAILNIVGWLLTRYGITDQATFHLIAPPPEKGRAQAHHPGGLGGIPRLLLQTTTPCLAFGFAMLALQPLMQLTHAKHASWLDLVEAFCVPTFNISWYGVLIVLTPVMGHLRLLRTLPMDAARLAAVLLTLVALPLLLLGMLNLTGAGLFLEPSVLPRVAQTHAFALIPALLSLPLIVWLGVSQFTIPMFMMATQFLQMWLVFWGNSKTLPLSPIAFAVILTLALSYALLWLILRRSTRAFRVRPNPFAAWAAAR